MKLSTICILVTLGVLSLRGFSGSVWIYEGEPYSATPSFPGCDKGREKGEEYSSEGWCGSCTCLGDKTTCRRCEYINMTRGYKFHRISYTLPFPNCCVYLKADPDVLGYVDETCQWIEYKGDAGTARYARDCSLYKNKDCEDLVKQGKRDSQQYMESCSNFGKRRCENLLKQGKTDHELYLPYCWVYMRMECENLAKQGKTDSEYYVQYCRVVKNGKCENLANQGKRDSQDYIENCWVAYNGK